MKRALVLAACAACKSGHGADLEITAVDGLDVEVFVAPDECEDGKQVPACSTDVAWDTVPGPVHGDHTTILDIDERTTATPLGHGRYRVVLDGQDGRDQKIDRILVVGFQNGVAMYGWRIKDAVIPGSSEERWDLPLAMIQDIPKNDPPSTSNGWRIHAWARTDPTRAKCVVTEQWSGGQVEREFYLPAADTDCDDVPPANECAPYFYRDMGVSTIDQSDCTAVFPWPSGQSTCELGGPGCNEVMPGSTQLCTEVLPRYCAPDAFCDPTCSLDLATCIDQGHIAHLDCTVVVMDTGASCTSAPYRTTVSLGQLVANAPIATQCLAPAFSDIASPPTFTSPWTPAGGGPTLTSLPSSTGGTCVFDLQLDVTAGTTPQQVIGALEVPLSNGRHEVLPISITFMTGCTSGAMLGCQLLDLSGGDSITNCATAPPQ